MSPYPSGGNDRPHQPTPHPHSGPGHTCLSCGPLQHLTSLLLSQPPPQSFVKHQPGQFSKSCVRSCRPSAGSPDSLPAPASGPGPPACPSAPGSASGVSTSLCTGEGSPPAWTSAPFPASLSPHLLTISPAEHALGDALRGAGLFPSGSLAPTMCLCPCAHVLHEAGALQGRAIRKRYSWGCTRPIRRVLTPLAPVIAEVWEPHRVSDPNSHWLPAGEQDPAARSSKGDAVWTKG